MAEVFVLALSFPSVVFTVLLGVVLVYWLFVMAGVVHIGEGSEGALEGKLEGAAKGALEGAAGYEAGDALELGDAGEPGALAALMSALHLRQVPATVILSLLITFSWLSSVVAMQIVSRALPAAGGWLGALVLLAAPILALPMTSLAARPLAKLLAPRRAPLKSDFIGKTCVVRTGSVTDKLGEATLEDGGAGLVIRVRVQGGAKLGRGEHALIVDWDAERESYLIEPMRDVMSDRK